MSWHSSSLLFDRLPLSSFFYFFFFNDTATTEIYTLSLHDALPISRITCWISTSASAIAPPGSSTKRACVDCHVSAYRSRTPRSEEHTSELQSRSDLVCRLLLEKKKHTNGCNFLCSRFCLT